MIKDKSKPDRPEKIRDEFLSDLIRTFGHEKGVELYQAGVVTKEDLAGFTALLEKFDATITQKAPITYRNAYHSGPPTALPPRRTAGTDPS